MLSGDYKPTPSGETHYNRDTISLVLSYLDRHELAHQIFNNSVAANIAWTPTFIQAYILRYTSRPDLVDPTTAFTSLMSTDDLSKLLTAHVDLVVLSYLHVLDVEMLQNLLTHAIWYGSMAVPLAMLTTLPAAVNDKLKHKHVGATLCNARVKHIEADVVKYVSLIPNYAGDRFLRKYYRNYGHVYTEGSNIVTWHVFVYDNLDAFKEYTSDKPGIEWATYVVHAARVKAQKILSYMLQAKHNITDQERIMLFSSDLTYEQYLQLAGRGLPKLDSFGNKSSYKDSGYTKLASLVKEQPHLYSNAAVVMWIKYKLLRLTHVLTTPNPVLQVIHVDRSNLIWPRAVQNLNYLYLKFNRWLLTTTSSEYYIFAYDASMFTTINATADLWQWVHPRDEYELPVNWVAIDTGLSSIDDVLR